LCVVCDAEVCGRAGWTIVDFASACLQGGARFLQIRAKLASTRWFFDAVLAVVDQTRPAGAVLIVNDRADIARLARADGVHVGQDDLSPREARSVMGDTGIIGLSTHTLAQIEAGISVRPVGMAREPVVSYVAIGPIFTTATKATGYGAGGLDRVREAAARTEPRGVPLVAIGGITLERAPAVIDAGAQAVAVISDLLTAGDPAKRVSQFLAALK
jgi:thiamine-phosphate pyrophosphorylase